MMPAFYSTPPVLYIRRFLRPMRLAVRKKRDKIRLLHSWAGNTDTRGRPFYRAFHPRPATRCFLCLWGLFQGSVARPSRFATINLITPPLVKIRALQHYARKFGLRTFVETGTFVGDTTAAVARSFDRCFTIELSDDLHARAVKRFAAQPHIVCVHGDSGAAISDILHRIDQPALFWLDAHYSGGITADAGYDPILKELSSIFAHSIKSHVVLIDDARGHQIDAIAGEIPAGHLLSVKNDIVRIAPDSKTGRRDKA
jgi:hypothetical protein